MGSGRRTPAWLRQIAGAICLLALIGGDVFAQNRGNRLLPRYVTVAPPDQEEGAKILAEFRQLGLPGDYYLEFALEVLPRRGERRSIPGRLWGTRSDVGPLTRLELSPPAPAPEERLLVQNGPEPSAWIWRGDRPDAGVERLSVERLLEPLAGSNATAFDLQMPFVHWPDFVFEGVNKIRGRTAHTFLLYPPDDFAAAHPDVAGVRIHLDLQFHALMQAVVLNQAEQPARTLTIQDLKKVGGQWIIKSIDVREEKTRDKTRFQVKGAALDLELSSGLFTSEQLAERVGAPARVERFN